MNKALDRLNAYFLVLYYTLIMVFGVLIKHPVHLAIILAGGVAMAWIVAGAKTMLRTLGYALIMDVLIILINPLVSKEGMTKIMEIGTFYVTLESVVYGAVSALMLTAVFMWFVSFNAVMTGDKYIYVLGRFLPSFSLLISLTLRLIPELNREYERERNYAKSLGLFLDDGFKNKFRLSMYALRGVIRHSIENSGIRADSMEARGYGIAHRSSYLKYKVRCTDIIFFVCSILLGTSIIAFHVIDADFASYYPIINIKISGTYAILSIVSIALFVLVPIVYELREVARWKRYLIKTSA